MQETNELSLNVVTPFYGVPSQNPVMPLGLVAPYQQQTHDINNMLQNQMTIELHKQLRSLEERAVFCLNVKDKALEEANKKCKELETNLTNALVEADYWRSMMEQRTELCRDLAGRLLYLRRKKRSTRRIGDMNFAEEAESSTGDNEEDVVETASRTYGCKRRCL